MQLIAQQWPEACWALFAVEDLPLTGDTRSDLFLSHMVERDTLAQSPGPEGWCVCGQKVIIADAREVTLPNGRPGWQGYCPECGSPLFAIRREAPGS